MKNWFLPPWFIICSSPPCCCSRNWDNCRKFPSHTLPAPCNIPQLILSIPIAYLVVTQLMLIKFTHFLGYWSHSHPSSTLHWLARDLGICPICEGIRYCQSGQTRVTHAEDGKANSWDHPFSHNHFLSAWLCRMRLVRILVRDDESCMPGWKSCSAHNPSLGTEDVEVPYL